MAEKHFVPKADREYTKADFTSDQMVKWCPGCGDQAILARMKGDLPVAIGVIRNVKKTSYTQLYEDQMEEQMANGKYKCVDDLLNSGDTWEI